MAERGTEHGGADTPMHSGGGDSALDLTNERDRGLVRKATRQWPKRWAGLDPEFKSRCKKQLEIAIDEADSVAMSGTEGAVAEAAKIRLSVVKTAVMMEGQNQKDDHAEAGVASTTTNVTVNTIIAIPPPSRARIDAD